MSAGILQLPHNGDSTMFEITIITIAGNEIRGWVSAKDLPKHLRVYAKNELIKTLRIERARVDVLAVE